MQHNPRIRAVMVGCGAMSNLWLQSAQQIAELEIVGLVDLLEEAAKRRATEHNLQQALIGTNLRAVLDQTSPDVVFNCTVPEAHMDVTLEALAHGCHILCEKPMADTLEHAQTTIRAAQQVGKLYAVIQNRRYDLNIRRLKSFLATQPLGPITTIHSDFFIGAHFGGFRDHLKHVLLLDMAIHTFDAARFLTDADPVAVYCKEWNPVGSWYDQDASAVAIFEMTNGMVYTYRGSWCAEGLPTTWEADWRIIGPRGSVHWDGTQQINVQTVASTGGFLSTYTDPAVPPYDSQGKDEGHASIIREFVSCIVHGGTPETICTDNIKSLAMGFAAIESAERGERVVVTW